MPISTQAPGLSDYDLYLLWEGTHYRAYAKMGAHLGEVAGRRGVNFAVWAPDAAWGLETSKGPSSPGNRPPY